MASTTPGLRITFSASGLSLPLTGTKLYCKLVISIDLVINSLPDWFSTHCRAANVLQDAHWIDLGVSQSDDVSAEIADVSETERKRREAVWELFRSECVFLIDHLMVLKHVSVSPAYSSDVLNPRVHSRQTTPWGWKKEPIFFCVHFFSTWQKLVIFSHTLGLRKVDLG